MNDIIIFINKCSCSYGGLMMTFSIDLRCCTCVLFRIIFYGLYILISFIYKIFIFIIKNILNFIFIIKNIFNFIFIIKFKYKNYIIQRSNNLE